MTSNTLKRIIAAPLIGLLATTAAAQDDAEAVDTPADAPANVTAEITLDYVTNYFFRGIEQTDSDRGVVLQPGFSLTFPICPHVNATVGAWASLHSDTPNATTSPSEYFEQDYYGHLEIDMGDFTALVGFTHYHFPSIGGADITEINLGLSFDDSELLGDFSFQPYVLVAIETQNRFTGTAFDSENHYIEFGGEFSLDPLVEGTALEGWSWGVPVAVGLSIKDYYFDASGAEEFFGFVSVGLIGSIPLEDLLGTDEYVGAWDLSAGVIVIFVNGDAVMTDNSSDAQFIGTIGISREYD